MKIAIIDDELFFISYLKRIVMEIDAHATIYSFSNRDDLLRHIGYQTYDVLFIDVDLRYDNGIDIARTLRKTSQIPIVFMTGYLNRLYDLHDIDILAILSKPFNDDDIRKILKRIPNTHKYPVLWVDSEQEKVAVHLSEIIYVETYYGGCSIITEHMTLTTTRYLFKKSLPVLQDYGFIRIQQSFYVNPEHIQSLTSSHITLTHKYQLSIGHAYLKDTRKAYTSYLKENSSW